MAGAFDHCGAGVAQLVGLFKESNAFAFELGRPGIETSDAQADMIHQVAARALQRPTALVGIRVHRHTAETDTCGRGAVGAFPG